MNEPDSYIPQAAIRELDDLSDKIASVMAENPSMNVIPFFKHISEDMQSYGCSLPVIEYVLRRAWNRVPEVRADAS